MGKTKNLSPQVGLRTPFTRNWFPLGSAKSTKDGEKSHGTNTNRLFYSQTKSETKLCEGYESS